ncbi:MAG: hypothetical protein RI935_196 [Candidatus Parcubacteria bacterium]|jgi:hypothetical protein
MKLFKRSALVPFFILLVILTACNKKEETGTKPVITPKVQETPLPQKPAKEEKKDAIRGHAENSQAVHVDTSSIAGRKLGGLYADITGISGVVGKGYTIDYGKILADLWIRKLDRKNVSPATVKASEEPISLYLAEQKKMNLKQFIKEAEKEVTLVQNNLDFQSACKGYKLSVGECEMFKTLARDVRGVDLVAYGMTELMPSAEGDLNVKIMEILLTNAGSNYLFTIPALYDRMLSLGFYQFTSYAVNSGTGQGASRMNAFLKKEAKIPGSVIRLRNGEHHRAAYLFALDNLANLSKRTSEKEFAALKGALKHKPGDIVTFIATAHHAPRLALKSMKNWLSKGGKGSLNDHLIGRLKPYGRKSDNNLAALEKLR